MMAANRGGRSDARERMTGRLTTKFGNIYFLSGKKGEISQHAPEVVANLMVPIWKLGDQGPSLGSAASD
jgi:hypothetical protein